MLIRCKYNKREGDGWLLASVGFNWTSLSWVLHSRRKHITTAAVAQQEHDTVWARLNPGTVTSRNLYPHRSCGQAACNCKCLPTRACIGPVQCLHSPHNVHHGFHHRRDQPCQVIAELADIITDALVGIREGLVGQGDHLEGREWRGEEEGGRGGEGRRGETEEGRNWRH